MVAAPAVQEGPSSLPIVATMVWLQLAIWAVWLWSSFAWRTAQFYLRALVGFLLLSPVLVGMIATASPMALLWILVGTAVWAVWCLGFYRQGRFGYTMIHVVAGLALPISCLGIVLFLAS